MDKRGNIVLLAALLVPMVFYGIKATRVLSNLSKQTLRRDSVSEDIASDCAYECAKAYDIMYTWEEQAEKMYKIADSILNTRVQASHGSNLINTDANGVRVNKNDPQLVLRYDYSYGKTGIIHCTINTSATQRVHHMEGGIEDMGPETYITKTYCISSTGSATPPIYYQNLDIVGCIPCNDDARTRTNSRNESANEDPEMVSVTLARAFKSIVEQLHYKFSQASIIPYTGRVYPDSTFLPLWTTPHEPLILKKHQFSLKNNSDNPGSSNTYEPDTSDQLRNMHETAYCPISVLYHLGFPKNVDSNDYYNINENTLQPSNNTISLLVGEKHTDLLSNADLTTQQAKMYALQSRYSDMQYLYMLKRQYQIAKLMYTAEYPIYHLSPEREDTFAIENTFRKNLRCVQECDNLIQKCVDYPGYYLAQSNFTWLAAHWSYNMLHKTWAQSTRSIEQPANTDEDSHLSTKKRKKVAIIFINKDDAFESNECTYLGFNNDYAVVPTHESSIDDFENNDETSYTYPLKSLENPHTSSYRDCAYDGASLWLTNNADKYTDVNKDHRLFLESKHIWNEGHGVYTVDNVQGKYVEIEVEPGSVCEQKVSVINVINPSWIHFYDRDPQCNINDISYSTSSNPNSFSSNGSYSVNQDIHLTSLNTKYRTLKFPKTAFRHPNYPSSIEDRIATPHNFGEYKVSFTAKNCSVVDAVLKNQDVVFSFTYLRGIYNQSYLGFGDAGMSITPPHAPFAGGYWYPMEACPGTNQESVYVNSCSCSGGGNHWHYYKCANYSAGVSTCTPSVRFQISAPCITNSNGTLITHLCHSTQTSSTSSHTTPTSYITYYLRNMSPICAVKIRNSNPVTFARTDLSYNNNSVSLKRQGDKYYVCFSGVGDLYLTIKNNSNNTYVSTEPECPPCFYKYSGETNSFPRVQPAQYNQYSYNKCKTISRRHMDTGRYRHMKQAYDYGCYRTDASCGWDAHLRINRDGRAYVSSPFFQETTPHFYWTFWRNTVPRYTWYNGRRITEYAAHTGQLVSNDLKWPATCNFSNSHTWMADWQNWSSYITRIICTGVYWHDLGSSFYAPAPRGTTRNEINHHLWRNSIRSVTPCNYEEVPTTKSVVTPVRAPAVVKVEGVSSQGHTNNGMSPGTGMRTIQGRTKLYFTAEEVTSNRLSLKFANVRLIRVRVKNFDKHFPTEHNTPGKFSITQLSGIANIDRCYKNSEPVALNSTISVTRPTTLLLIPQNGHIEYPDSSAPDSVIRFNAQNVKINDVVFSSPVYKLSDTTKFTNEPESTFNGMPWVKYNINQDFYQKLRYASYEPMPRFAIQSNPTSNSVFIFVGSTPTEGFQFPGSLLLDYNKNFWCHDAFGGLPSAKFHSLDDATLYNGNVSCTRDSAYFSGQAGDILSRDYPSHLNPVLEDAPYRYIFISLEPSYGHIEVNGRYEGGRMYLRQPTDLSYSLRGCELFKFGSLRDNTSYPTDTLRHNVNVSYDEVYGHHIDDRSDGYITLSDESQLKKLKGQLALFVADGLYKNGEIMNTYTSCTNIDENPYLRKYFNFHDHFIRYARLHSVAITKPINKALLRCGYQTEDETATDGVKKLSKAAFQKLCNEENTTVYIVLYNKNAVIQDVTEFSSINARRVFTISQESEIRGVMDEIMEDINKNVCPKKIYQRAKRVSRVSLR